MNIAIPSWRAAWFRHRFSSRSQVVFYQAPLSGTLLLLKIGVAVVSPVTLLDPRVQSSAVLHLVILGLCAVVPWGRLPASAPFVIPLLDMFAIGLSREVDPIVLGSMSLLLFYPVIWLATAGPVLGPLLTLVGAVLTLVPSFVAASLLTVRPVLLPLVLVCVSITMSLSFHSLKRARRKLMAKDADLKRLLREAEEREQLLSTIVDTVSVGVLALDKRGEPIIVNHEQRAHMKGVIEPPQSLASSMPIFAGDKITPIPISAHPIQRAANGEAFVDQLVWAENGEDRVALAVTARVMTDDHGSFAGSVLAFTNITTLVKALTAKDDFVANISHEIRTPLTSLLGYLELVRDGPFALPVEAMEYLDVAERNAQRLNRIVTDVLATASSEITVSLQQTDLSAILAARVAAAQAAADTNRVQLILDQPETVTAYVDAGQIARVMDNLLSNAIKFSPSGGTATVRVRRTAQDVVVEISDTGMGMSPDEQSQAFTKFFRSPTHKSAAIPGVGLGLLMSKTIVESHGGRLSLSSHLGVGTTVTMNLPAQ
ncbi:MAG: HAMP domain-containing sensor histidine kinase [Mycetocola sp.]